MLIERVLHDGTRTREWLPPLAAAVEAVAGAQNGVTVARLIVRWNGVIDNWTRSA
ncbi:MAG TPA: hypothetical protein VII92_06890 [Anaerolineae bacterium]